MSMYQRLAAYAARLTAAALSVMVLPATAVAATAAPSAQPGPAFVTRSGSQLLVQGRPFRFAGTNNYYLHYQSAKARDNVLEKAAASGLPVVRTWGWFDTGT